MTVQELINELIYLTDGNLQKEIKLSVYACGQSDLIDLNKDMLSAPTDSNQIIIDAEYN